MDSTHVTWGLEGVESRSDGVHRIHWKRIDSDGKVHFSIREGLRKFHSCCIRGWKGVPMESCTALRMGWKQCSGYKANKIQCMIQCQRKFFVKYSYAIRVACSFRLIALTTSYIFCVACLFWLIALRTTYVYRRPCLFRLMALRTGSVAC